MADGNTTVKPTMVQLKTETRGEGSKPKTRKFDSQVALKLLTNRNPKWKLDDSAFEFNGKELVKKSK